MVDLHVHSTKSDGTYTPSELVDYAIEKGLKAFALTDHDTVAGLDEVLSYADSLRKEGKTVPEVIPGIELSTEYEGENVHIVGLFIDYKCKAFTDYLKNFVDAREIRNRKMCQKLTEGGYPVTYEELEEYCGEAVITRAHFPGLLMKKGYCKSRNEAFERFIGDRAPFYVPREKIAPVMAVELILKAGGIPIFAHPMLCKLGKEKFLGVMDTLKEAGLIGIEAFYCTNTLGEQNQTIRLAEKYHLLLSGGSDFHGKNKPDLDLGTGYGKLHVPDSCLEDLKKACKKVLFTDMDGTLLLSDSTISNNMKKALDDMVAKGHKLVLTSGRPLHSILERIVKLGLNYSDSYVISFNGGLIYDCDKKEVIRSLKVPQDIVREVIAIADEAGIHAHCYSDTHIIVKCEDSELDFYRNRVHMPYQKVSDMADALPDGSYKVLIIDLTDKSKLEDLRIRILKKLGNRIDAFFSNDKYLEILPKGINKGDAVRFLASYIPVPLSNTYASGDEDNDIPMIKAAGHGIAMKNAIDEAKAAAEIITSEDNNHDGLIEVINKYFK